MTIEWGVTKPELDAISKIADRYVDLYQKARPDEQLDKQNTVMDLIATHKNGCPLKLDELAVANDFDLMHDVHGIYNHINRLSGQLERCFLPRYAKPEEKSRV